MGSLESESGCWVSVVWHAKCMPLEPSILGTHWRKFETLVLVTGIIWWSDDYPSSVCLPTESNLKSHKYVLSNQGSKTWFDIFLNLVGITDYNVTFVASRTGFFPAFHWGIRSCQWHRHKKNNAWLCKFPGAQNSIKLPHISSSYMYQRMTIMHDLYQVYSSTAFNQYNRSVYSVQYTFPGLSLLAMRKNGND